MSLLAFWLAMSIILFYPYDSENNERVAIPLVMVFVFDLAIGLLTK